MSLIGTLLFCTDCSNLLPRQPPTTPKIFCQICTAVNSNKWPTQTVTASKPDAFPSKIREKRSDIKTIDVEVANTWPTTAQTCGGCGNGEMYYREMQLRGADEGSTVFYRCTKCSYTSRSDN